MYLPFLSLLQIMFLLFGGLNRKRHHMLKNMEYPRCWPRYGGCSKAYAKAKHLGRTKSQWVLGDAARGLMTTGR